MLTRSQKTWWRTSLFKIYDLISCCWICNLDRLQQPSSSVCQTPLCRLPGNQRRDYHSGQQTPRVYNLCWCMTIHAMCAGAWCGLADMEMCVCGHRKKNDTLSFTCMCFNKSFVVPLFEIIVRFMDSRGQQLAMLVVGVEPEDAELEAELWPRQTLKTNRAQIKQ